MVENLRAACPQVDYLVVNDCSTDNSVEILRAQGYNYLDLPVNLGIGGGVQCGYRYAREHGYDVTAVSYTHLDVYKRQPVIPRKYPKCSARSPRSDPSFRP